MEDEGEYNEVKIVIIGNSGVGKTSMINRYLKKTFDENSSTTIGAMYMNKVEEVGDTTYKMQVSSPTLINSNSPDLGYRRTGTVQNHRPSLLQRRTGNHHRVRRY